LSADKIIALKYEEDSSAFEGIEINFSFLLRKWMISVVGEASPKKLDRGIGDCGYRASGSDVIPKGFSIPV